MFHPKKINLVFLCSSLLKFAHASQIHFYFIADVSHNYGRENYLAHDESLPVHKIISGSKWENECVGHLKRSQELKCKYRKFQSKVAIFSKNFIGIFSAEKREESCFRALPRMKNRVHSRKELKKFEIKMFFSCSIDRKEFAVNRHTLQILRN